MSNKSRSAGHQRRIGVIARAEAKGSGYDAKSFLPFARIQYREMCAAVYAVVPSGSRNRAIESLLNQAVTAVGRTIRERNRRTLTTPEGGAE